MVAIKIENFGGEIPAVDDRLLPDNAASRAVNTWLFSGRIEPLHSLTPLYNVVDPATRAVFRLPKGSPSIDNMVDSYWLEFENQNVRPIRSPVAQQTDDGRYYWADGVLPKMMTGDMIAAADTPRTLGIPGPSVAPVLTNSGGSSSTLTTIAYVYTWVSDLGEEGPPSDPTTIASIKIDSTVHVAMAAPSGADNLNRALTLTRVYRTVVSDQGVASFFFVTEQPIATLTFDDNLAADTDAVVSNNEQLTSLNYQPPPTDLQQLVNMGNGMVAGFREAEVWFCEPYQPHAYPVQYVIEVPNKIVGLGVIGSSLMVLTQGQPWSATGTDPSSMALAAVQPLEPCTSILSIVGTPAGVLYASPNGLINITPYGATNLTLSTITKDQWANLLNLDSIAASIIALGYYCYSIATVGVFQNSVVGGDSFTAFQQDTFQQDSNYGTEPGVYIKLDDNRIGLTELDPRPHEIENVITDLFNGETMVLRDGTVFVVDLRQPTPYATYTWRSKIVTLDFLQNLSAAKVYYTPAQDPNAGPSYFRVYAGGYADLTQDGLPLRFQQVMTVPGQMFRLPSGYKALYWQFEVSGEVIVDAIHVASSPRELRMV